MTASDNLSGQQFFPTLYRGLHFGNIQDLSQLHDPEFVMKHLRPIKEENGLAFGSHWSTSPEVARTFARGNGNNMGNKWSKGNFERRMSGHTWGTVLELRPNPGVTGFSSFEGNPQYGESEVEPPRFRKDISDIVAHIHVDLQNTAAVKDRDISTAYRAQRGTTHLTSFVLPRHIYDDGKSQKRFDKWQKEYGNNS